MSTVKFLSLDNLVLYDQLLKEYITNAILNDSPICKGNTDHSGILKNSENTVSGNFSIALGYGNKVERDFSTATGYNNIIYENCCFATGINNAVSGANSYVEGRNCIVTGHESHAEGMDTHAMGIASHTEGRGTYAAGNASHAEGLNNKSGVNGFYFKGIDIKNKKIYLSTTKPENIKTSGFTASDFENIDFPYDIETDMLSIINGNIYYDCLKVTQIKNKSVIYVESLPFTSVAEFNELFKNSNYTIFCLSKYNLGAISVSFGSHSEGYESRAFGIGSHSEGYCTITKNIGEHASGIYNKSNNNTLFSIGIGSADTERKNAFEVNKNGDMYILGIGDYDGTNANSSKTLEYFLKNHTHEFEVENNGNITLSSLESILQTFNAHINTNSASITNVRNIIDNYNTKNTNEHMQFNNSIDLLNELTSDMQGEIIDITKGIADITKGIADVNADINILKAYNDDINILKAYKVLEIKNNSSGVLTNSDNITNSNHSIVLGFGNKTENDYEFATGKYNNSIKTDDETNNTLFSVGIGIDDEHRANALEIKQNGDVRIDNGVLYASAISRSGYAVIEKIITPKYSKESNSAVYNIDILSSEMNGMVYIICSKPSYKEYVNRLKLNIRFEVNDLILNNKQYCDISHLMINTARIYEETGYDFISSIEVYFKLKDSSGQVMAYPKIYIASIGDNADAILIPFKTAFLEINALLRNTSCYIVASKYKKVR